jgi:hypothetical protein
VEPGQAVRDVQQYTLDGGKSPDFGPVATYFEDLVALLNNSPQVFVGETGYNAANGEMNEVLVIEQIFGWLTRQKDGVGNTIPLFPFMAFDDLSKRGIRGRNERASRACRTGATAKMGFSLLRFAFRSTPPGNAWLALGEPR